MLVATTSRGLELSLFVVIVIFGRGCGEEVTKKSVKIVDAPVVSRAYHSTYNSKKLTARAEPVAFRGPEALRLLRGTCLSLVDGSYKYEVCPFQNVTQHEQSTRWNAYKGVLGVFQGWNVVNGSLQSQIMLDGDACGTTGNFRQAEVVFTCSLERKLSSASEPSTCHYRLLYETPLACNSSLLAVYYLLNTTQRSQWQEVQELYFHDELTYKGVLARMEQIYQEADIVPKPRKGSGAEKESSQNHNAPAGTQSSARFSSLAVCEKAHGELEEKIKGLEAELALLRSNGTHLNASAVNATSERPQNTSSVLHKNATVASKVPSADHHVPADEKEKTDAADISPGASKDDHARQPGLPEAGSKAEQRHTVAADSHAETNSHEAETRGVDDKVVDERRENSNSQRAAEEVPQQERHAEQQSNSSKSSHHASHSREEKHQSTKKRSKRQHAHDQS